VSIREWSAAYYGQAEAGKGILYYNNYKLINGAMPKAGRGSCLVH